MCGRSANFNSAVFLAACGLLTAGSGGEIANDEQLPVLRDDPRCSPSLSVVLSMENSGDGVAAASRTLEKNSSLLHNNTVYPAHLRWTDGNITYGCACKLRNCIRKCCRGDEVLTIGEKIIEMKPICQKIFHNDTMPARVKTPDLRLSKEQMAEEIQNIDELREHFLLLENFICPAEFYPLDPDEFPEDEVILQANGSLIGADGTVFPLWNYCIDWQMTFDRIGILVCLPQNVIEENIDIIYTAAYVGIAVSIPFLVATFLVYAIIPELKNLYGKTLMCYVICLITAYIFLLLVNYISMSSIRTLCFITAFVIYFSFLASFFWLNVMCFDIWWTFGGFHSLQGNVEQREKKKFIMYSIYAWGSASILTIVCAIMDFVPSVPRDFIRPEFDAVRCWFNTDEAKALYFYGPMSITVVCNIWLLISTALKIVCPKKDTAHHLRGSESRRHDDNKEWFNLYLKLFIVVSINWSMEIVSWLFKSASPSVWYLTDLTNILQGLIIFIIFVWKKKIKRLLLKRFGRGLFSRNSTRSGHSSASRTCTTTSGRVIPPQEKISLYVQAGGSRVSEAQFMTDMQEQLLSDSSPTILPPSRGEPCYVEYPIVKIEIPLET